MVAYPEVEQRIVKLTPLAEALAAIDAVARPVEPREADVSAALARVLAADAKAPAMQPASAVALHDGWAVRSDETIDAGSYAPALLSALPRRVDFGQPLPRGADAVAPLDTVVLRGSQAEALATVAPGEGVLSAGRDAEAGFPLRAAGERLRAVDLALLSVAGISRVAIREPRIRLVRAHAGSAVIAAGYGWIAEILAAAGAVVIPDAGDAVAPDHLTAAFHHEDSDAILVLGGTGSGTPDASVIALAKAGRVAFHGVGLIPGETAAFGAVGARTVLLLPGRFDAGLAAWLTLGRHWLNKLSAADEEDRIFMAQLARKVTSPLGMAEVVPVRCRGGSAEPLASGYLSYSALARADGWILVPPESEGYPPSAQVAVRALP
ncbi:MAG TPA: molybdopterin-binding protein [Xanthobacteraceae bacterium]|nr:molybdopterin-binding protein [Xanthobacteraceae bacterium]